jgi:hypothetical protein
MGCTNRLFQGKATTLKEDIHTIIDTPNRIQVEHMHNLNMVNHRIAILGMKKMN